MLPVGFGGIGVREVALAALLGQVGIPPAVTVGYGLAWETILVAGGSVGGLFYALSGGSHWVGTKVLAER